MWNTKWSDTHKQDNCTAQEIHVPPTLIDHRHYDTCRRLSTHTYGFFEEPVDLVNLITLWDVFEWLP